MVTIHILRKGQPIGEPPGLSPGLELLGPSLVLIILVEFLLHFRVPLLEGLLLFNIAHVHPHELLHVGAVLVHGPHVDTTEPSSVQDPVISFALPIDTVSVVVNGGGGVELDCCH